MTQVVGKITAWSQAHLHRRSCLLVQVSIMYGKIPGVPVYEAFAFPCTFLLLTLIIIAARILSQSQYQVFSLVTWLWLRPLNVLGIKAMIG